MKRVLLTISLALLIFGLAAEDAMYGAFRVITKPRGADVTLYDADMYLSRTPTPVYPVWMDEYMDLVEGIPGRHIMLMITKKGYIPIRQEIFVPFTHEDEGDALECPSVFVFELEKDVKRAYHKVCIYYGYKYRKPRPPVYVYYHPWYPPAHYVWSPSPPPPPRPPRPPKPPVVHTGSVTATSSGPSIGTPSGRRNKLDPPPPPGGPKQGGKTKPPRKEGSVLQLPSKIKSAIQNLGGSKEVKNKTEPEKRKSSSQKSYSGSSNNTRAPARDSSPLGTSKPKRKEVEEEPKVKSSSKRK